MSIEKIQKERGITLPRDYLQFLSKLDVEQDYCFNDDPEEYPDFEGRCWWFFDEVRLARIVEMSRVGAAPAHRQLELYLKCYQDFSDCDSVYSDEGELSIARVADGFVVAEENGDLLYLDPHENFSVWIYHHDGSDVTRVAGSIGEWLAKATLG